MASLLGCNEIAKTHGTQLLFSGLSLTLEDGARLGLIGPNGSGKTTLLEILAGVQKPDAGERSLRRAARVGYVPQDSVFPAGASVREVAALSLEDSGLDETERDVRISVALSKAGFERDDALTETLSGGWKKRLAIAAQLVGEPDVLLLDEPTNHLDLDGIGWLERLLKGEKIACVFVSHDRYFLENVADEIAEINPAYPDGVYRASGSYSLFLEKREDYLATLSKRREALATVVRREIEWLRRGPKARTSKSRGRIDRAHEQIGALSEMNARNQTATAGIDFTSSDRKTKRLVMAEGIAKSLGGRKLFGDLDLVLAPGVRLGVVGPNGSGKSTLLKTLLGELEPDTGEVRRAKDLRTVTLDQHRAGLPTKGTLERALCPDGDSVLYRGSPIHVVAWAKRFLFRKEQLALPVGDLSGGERARVAIAALVRQEADLLALDEPTNDLDIPTLEVLERTLLDFPGAMLLITHDRYLLDRVATAVVGLDGDGEARLYADYRQWEQARADKRRERLRDAQPVAGAETQAVGARAVGARAAEKKPRKLSYKDQIEWDAMEGKILEAEEELSAATAAMENLEGMRDPLVIQQRHRRLQTAQSGVDRLYGRWTELEAKLA